MTLKPAPGRRRRFQDRAHIWNVALPLIKTHLIHLHWVSPRCPTYLLGALLFLCLRRFEQKTKTEWFHSNFSLRFPHEAWWWKHPITAKLVSYQWAHLRYLWNICTSLLSAAFFMPHFRVLAANLPLCCPHFIWWLARWAIQPRAAPRSQNFTSFKMQENYRYTAVRSGTNNL